MNGSGIDRPAKIETSRLHLVVMLPSEIRALIAGDAEQASRLAGVLFPPGWPEAEEAREGLPWHLRHLESNAAHTAWRIRVVVERATDLVIGSVNLKGPPDSEGDVEIGWGISEPYRRRGYALEAVSSVIDWALSQSGTKSLSATIDDDNIASQNLAARLGLVRTARVRRDKPVWYRLANRLIKCDQGKNFQLEGIVHASRYEPGAPGKQFLGAAIECSDATVWVIDYSEQSPFHAFNGRQVVATGEPYIPKGQHLIGWAGGKSLGHFRVSSLRPVDVTDDADLAEVGTGHNLPGRFRRGLRLIGKSALTFVTDNGDVFTVANDPAGVRVGRSVEVWAYPVKPSRSIQGSQGRYLWIICPHSAEELWAWRGREGGKSHGR